VWVTRDEGAEGPLCAALRARGLEPVLEPVIERRVIGDVGPMLAGLGPADWLVLTSPFAIGALPEMALACRVAVVGESSRAAALARGLRVGLVSPDGSGEGLWRRLREMVSSGLVVYPRSELAPAPEGWGRVRVEAPVLYATTARAFDGSVAGHVDAAAVASASAARAIHGTANLPRLASIGGATTAAMAELAMRAWVEAPEPTLEALAGAIAAGLDQLRRESGSSRHHRA
jgi:uroporphyrinogen-III synthase